MYLGASFNTLIKTTDVLSDKRKNIEKMIIRLSCQGTV